MTDNHLIFETVRDMLNILIQNKEFLGLVIAFLGVIFPLMIFLIGKNKEQRQANFEKFHNYLVNGLTNQVKNIGLEQQTAVIFEMRNFPEYYSVIKRILAFSRKAMEIQKNERPEFALLINEIDKTINYIDRNFIVRFFIRIKDKFF